MNIQATELIKTVEKETNLIGWKLSENNFQLELIQRSPQQTSSFFQARGFDKQIANDIATQCVFQTIIRNTQAENGKESITVSLSDWRLSLDNKSILQPIKLKETWDKEWQKKEISTAARIAFRWATFPSKQTFDPSGDFGWGMISFGLKPNTLFDLQLLWKQGEQSSSAWIKNLQCPADIKE